MNLSFSQSFVCKIVTFADGYAYTKIARTYIYHRF